MRYLGVEVDDALEMSEQTEIWIAISGLRPLSAAVLTFAAFSVE